MEEPFNQEVEPIELEDYDFELEVGEEVLIIDSDA